VLTRKRASAAADGHPSASPAKRSRTASSSPLAATPTGAGSPRASRPRQKASSVPKKGGLFESSLLAATALSAATSRRLAFEPFPTHPLGVQAAVARPSLLLPALPFLPHHRCPLPPRNPSSSQRAEVRSSLSCCQCPAPDPRPTTRCCSKSFPGSYLRCWTCLVRAVADAVLDV
jgi:hypothetical protein